MTRGGGAGDVQTAASSVACASDHFVVITSLEAAAAAVTGSGKTGRPIGAVNGGKQGIHEARISSSTTAVVRGGPPTMPPQDGDTGRPYRLITGTKSFLNLCVGVKAATAARASA